MFDRQKQLHWSKLKSGLVVTFSLLVLFMTVFFAGGIETLLSPKKELRAQILDVKGLRTGAPVWLSGIEIGSVKGIQLHPSHGAIVTLSIKVSALEYIRKDAQASVLTMGLLGDKYVEITAGSADEAPIDPQDTIKGVAHVELKDVMATSALSIERLNEFIRKLDHLVTQIDTGNGTVAKFIRDPALYDNLQDVTKTLAAVAREVREARGTLRLLIEDPVLYNKMVATAASADDLFKRLNSGSGTFGKLVDDPSLYDRLAGATASIEEFGKKINGGSGTLGKLADDPTLYESLSRASERLASVLERIDSGQGVPGTVVGDKDLTGELKGVAGELRELTKDIREHPKRYFKFSLF